MLIGMKKIWQLTPAIFFIEKWDASGMWYCMLIYKCKCWGISTICIY